RFHQADLRAYDGVHSVLGDLLDATLDKLEHRLNIQVLTPVTHALAQRFADRMQYESSGVRATLLRGRALLIDAGNATPVAVTGLPGGAPYGGEKVGSVMV